MPKATRALYDYANKYHQEHTGLDLRDASLKLRRSLQNSAEWAYQGAMRQIDEADIGLQKVARSTTKTYQQWKDKAQDLYQELLLAKGDQADFQGHQNEMFDRLIGVTREYKVIVSHQIDSLIDFLKLTRFQLPGKVGTYTKDEVYTVVMREVGQVLSQVYSKIHSGLEIMFSYFQDLMEKSELIKDLEIKIPFGSQTFKLIDLISEFGRLLIPLSQKLQDIFNTLQSLKTTEMLSDLRSYLQRTFQELEEDIQYLKEVKFTYFIDHIQYKINRIFNKYIPYVFQYLYLNIGKFSELVENQLQKSSQQLQQYHQIIKDLHKEYVDPNVVSWTARFYELEEKIISLLKNLVDVLKDLHSNYTVSTTMLVSEVSSQIEQFVQKDIQEYLSILTDEDGKGKKIAELSTNAQEIIKSWAIAMKAIISDYHQQFRYKLQDFSDQLSDYYEKFITESKRLIDLSIQKYHMFLRYITELLKELQSATVNNMIPYIKVSPGEFTITF